MKHVLSFAITCIILTGCQTISPEECKMADWYNRGANDGSEGVKASVIQTYRSECAEAGVKVNSVEWRKGYEQGLRSYCTAENGYLVGSEGRNYYGVCQNSKFIENYRLGKNEHELKQKRQEIRDEINKIRTKLNSETDKSKQKNLRKQIERLEDRLDSLYKPDVSFEINF